MPDALDPPGFAVLHIPRAVAPPHLAPDGTGVYLPDGLFGLGAAWYHFGAADDQLFVGHAGEADYFVLDFAVDASGGAAGQGADDVLGFEVALDSIVVVNNLAIVAPGDVYTVEAEALKAKGGADQVIAYGLTHLVFADGMALETDLGPLGIVRFFDVA